MTASTPRDGNDQNPAKADTTNDSQAAESPKRPDERDESVGSTNHAPDPTVAQGRRDVERGLSDTSRAEASDAAYQKQK